MNSPYLYKWELEPVMSLPIKTCVSIADSPSTAGSLLLDTGSTQLLSRNGRSPSLPSRNWLCWTNLCSLSTSWSKVKTQEGQKIIPYSPPEKKEFCVHKNTQKGTGMSKSVGSGGFNAAVYRKQSLQTDPEVYAREKERIWLLILFYDQLLLLMETQFWDSC